MEKKPMDMYAVGHQNLTINKISGRDKKRRQDLEKLVKATNQPGAFQSLDGQFFETEFKSGMKCNFPVSLVTYEGMIPKSKGVPEVLKYGIRTSIRMEQKMAYLHF